MEGWNLHSTRVISKTRYPRPVFQRGPLRCFAASKRPSNRETDSTVLGNIAETREEQDESIPEAEASAELQTRPEVGTVSLTEWSCFDW